MSKGAKRVKVKKGILGDIQKGFEKLFKDYDEKDNTMIEDLLDGKSPKKKGYKKGGMAIKEVPAGASFKRGK